MTQTRIRFFDIARGIAILCVILSHSVLMAGTVTPLHTLSHTIYAACFSFHMPLFFILSGYFMHPERKFRWGKELRELVGTYAVTACIVLAGIAIAAKGLRVSVRESLKIWGSAAVYAAGDISQHALWPQSARIGAIWFLLSLFWAHLLMHVFAKLPCTPVWVVVSFVIGYASARWIWLPWDIQSGMCTLAFVYVGYLMKQYDVLAWLKKYPAVWVLMAVVWLADIVLFSGFSLALNDYGKTPVLAALGGVAGTVCIIGISVLVDRVQRIGGILAWIGQTSLALLCAHLIEDDVLPWALFLTKIQTVLPHMPLWIVLFVVRLPLDFFLAWCLSKLPYASLWFYPMKAKQHALSVAQTSHANE
ncbi:acyltransferase family protein [Bifidobacterium callitrichidarum]|uniref:Acyltransferase n=1 Tax=Bifidobacterium callitrichidarum TaxID=2052941 RepID=A0A2U2N9N1_9BIFI|nr:acyltransferase family protein [Bifidobacterium callitrichidarum]PWG65915.1 acyltransferase [Bifidobacterium callitrichidarum]